MLSMDILVLPFFVFLELFKWVVFADIVLSWLSLFGLHIVIPLFHDILAPVYSAVYKYFPVRLGMLDFSSLIILLAIQFLELLILRFFPGVILHIPYIPLF